MAHVGDQKNMKSHNTLFHRLCSALSMLSPLAVPVDSDARRHIFPVIEGQDASVRFGWVQPARMIGQGFYIGVFLPSSMAATVRGKNMLFAPLAFADEQGHVYPQEPWNRGTAVISSQKPQFMMISNEQVSRLALQPSGASKLREAVRREGSEGSADSQASMDLVNPDASMSTLWSPITHHPRQVGDHLTEIISHVMKSYSERRQRQSGLLSPVHQDEDGGQSVDLDWSSDFEKAGFREEGYADQHQSGRTDRNVAAVPPADVPGQLSEGQSLDQQFAEEAAAVHVQGIMGCFDSAGFFEPTASWVRENATREYWVRDLRLSLPSAMVQGEYIDALAVGYLYSYLIPQLCQDPLGYGVGSITYCLRRFAPIAGIRTALDLTQEALNRGLKVSSMEWFFGRVVHESGALDDEQLQAQGGQEPLSLFMSADSGNFVISTPENGVEPVPAVHALRLEACLNRFMHVAMVMGREADFSTSVSPEETARPTDPAIIDRNLIDNPGFCAFSLDDGLFPTIADDRENRLFRQTYQLGQHSHEWWTAVVDSQKIAQRIVRIQQMRAAQLSGSHSSLQPNARSEWVYRMSLAQLFQLLRLPYRLDAVFHSCLRAGKVAIVLLGASGYLMPETEIDSKTKKYRKLSRAERHAMAEDYSLRVAILSAALAFYTSDAIDEVLVRVDGLDFAPLEKLDQIDAQQPQTTPNFTDSGENDALEDGADDEKSDASAHDQSDEHDHANLNKLMEDLQQMLAQSSLGKLSSARTTGKGAPKDHDVHGRMPSATSPTSDAEPEASQSASASAHKSSDEHDHAGHSSHDSTEQGGSHSDNDSSSEEWTSAHAHADINQRHGSENDSSDEHSHSQSGSFRQTKLSVRFTREAFMSELQSQGLEHPREFVARFGPHMHAAADGSLLPIHVADDTSSMEFRPSGAGQEPERSNRVFTPEVADVLGASDMHGITIERRDLVREAIVELQTMGDEVNNGMLDSVKAAHQASDLIQSTNDPELSAHADEVISALIDQRTVPDITLDDDRQLALALKKVQDAGMRGELASGNTQSVTQLVQTFDRIDAQFSAHGRVPRYFNSYAERIVYNKMFAIRGEKMVLVPDSLFLGRLEMSDLIGQMLGSEAENRQLNRLVQYAPAYPLASLKQSAALAGQEDWEGASAAALNALRVSLEGDDAAYAYYRLAYAEWMLGKFPEGVACYLMSNAIHEGLIPSLHGELDELRSRCQSQGIDVPTEGPEVIAVLKNASIPVWPHIAVADIVQKASIACVDAGLFIPAHTLALAAARMESGGSGVSVVQAQFIQSLGK